MSSSLDATIAQLIREVLPRRMLQVQMSDELSLREDLGIDSIGLMSLAFRLEEEFSIDLMEHTEEVTSVRTVGDVQRLIRRIWTGSFL